MPRKYSPSEKTAALEHLHKTGNFTLTAIQTGISERTLYTWRQQEFLQQTLQQRDPAPPLQKEIPEFEDDLERMSFLRQQIMDEMVKIAASFDSEMTYTSPAQRVSLLTQLTDRLIKLDAHIDARYEPEIIYVDEYEYGVAHHVEKNPPRSGPRTPGDDAANIPASRFNTSETDYSEYYGDTVKGQIAAAALREREANGDDVSTAAATDLSTFERPFEQF